MMRRIRFVPLLLAVLLLACQGTAPAGLAIDAVAVTPLDTAAPAPKDADTPHPKPKPATLADTPAPGVAPPEPEAPKSAAQMLCEKARGQWLSAGDTGANYCASLTRDGGKQCHKKGDCQGQCLARSGTCSPIMPLYGCNDILEKDGGEVTMCID
ncbi:MAG: hypothetical protein H7317_18855 [Pseudorhodobacter sp.]|nr:hypothetical protein [Pseudorhodobacter sp.]